MRVLGVDDGSADYFLVDFPLHPAGLHKTLHFTLTAKSSATLKPSPSSTIDLPDNCFVQLHPLVFKRGKFCSYYNLPTKLPIFSTIAY